MTDKTIPSTNWLDEEVKQTHTIDTNYEHKESLVLESGKVVKFKVDFSNPFTKWTDTKNDAVKAIIPVIHKDEAKNLWLNVKNPLYNQLCKLGLEGQTEFAVSTTGSQKDTRYNIVEED